MSDIISLLPDSVANQIAAGEVVQRPSSVVKELLENAVDAGASKITLIVSNAGKSLIQVIDDGLGMSVNDARMAFERHATSKINKAEDLFAIHSYGFRGEALASIASVARVELKTRESESEAGIHIIIEGSKHISQEMCSTSVGTSIAVKDLFFNIPARRQFLKSNNAEMRHIWDEFYRAALASPKIAFEIFDDKKLLIGVRSSNLHQRIIGLFGKAYQQRLIPVKEETVDVQLNGYIIKPEHAKKTRGEQYLFINDRYIRSSYINNSLRNAFEGLIHTDAFPGYYLFINLDPSEIDINIHPTKTEIKFRDERMVASIIASAVRRSLGLHHAMPSIDFESETTLNFKQDKNKEIKPPTIKVNPDYNPFKNKIQPVDAFSRDELVDRQMEFYNDGPKDSSGSLIPEESRSEKASYETYIQIANSFIASSMKSGLLLVNQNLAHQRILFDELIQKNDDVQASSEQLMFPESISLARSDAELMAEISDELNESGFVISQLGPDTFSVSALPHGIDLQNNSIAGLLESILEEFKSSAKLRKDFRKSVILSMARKLSIPEGRVLNQEMMQRMVSGLFQSSNPEIAPDGRRIFRIISSDELTTLLSKD
ncbi:MAG: DNA mismatch repair protein MutL [Marinilabiliales bacterium]|nr:MAG: DNA mismatch repair protein MutL [Marinilabiliales bacterium]